MRPHRLLCTLLIPAFLGCSDRKPERVLVDFAAGLAQGDVHRETRRLDLGADAVRPLLLDGWSADELWDGGKTTFVWGVGERSSVRIFHFVPEPLRLRFRCRPFDRPEGGPEAVAVAVNGKQVGEVPLRTDFQIYEVQVPAAALRTGENRIDFEYLPAGSPYVVAGRVLDRRPLAVAWDWIALDGPAPPAEETEAGAERGAVNLPWRTRLDFHLEAAPGSRIAWDGAQPQGEPRPGEALEVQVLRDGEAAPRTFRFTGEALGRAQEIELPGTAPEVARVSFLALPGGGRASGEGLRIVRPRLTADRLPPVPPPPREAVSSPRPLPRSRPNILLYVIDTLRADHLGSYGYPKPVSPNLDALAAESVVFESAYAQSGWTRTSLATILTGLTPFAHRVLGREDALPPSLPTLAGLLQTAGYETIGIVTNANVAPELGFGRGFNRYIPIYPRNDSPPAGWLNDELLSWLRGRRQGAPFFAYLHSLEPHDPYDPPEPFRHRFAPHLATALNDPDQVPGALAGDPKLAPETIRADFEALYDGEIAANDAAFGALVQGLRAAGLYEDTLILVVSDHGEEFLDHSQWGHGHSLYSEILHVPMILKLPHGRGAGERRTGVARHVDILPTLLAAAGARVPKEAQGRDLLAGAAPEAESPVLALLRLDGLGLASVIDRGRQLIRWNPDQPPGRVELYDLRNDPRERRDLMGQGLLWAGFMTSRLRQLRQAQERSVTVPRAILDGEVQRQLRALGYIR